MKNQLTKQDGHWVVPLSATDASDKVKAYYNMMLGIDYVPTARLVSTNEGQESLTRLSHQLQEPLFVSDLYWTEHIAN